MNVVNNRITWDAYAASKVPLSALPCPEAKTSSSAEVLRLKARRQPSIEVQASDETNAVN